MTDFKPITDQQMLFVEHYMTNFVVAEAAGKVGVSPATGYAWMDLPSVKAQILDAKHKITLRAQISADWTLEKLQNISNADIVRVLEALTDDRTSSTEPLKPLLERLAELPVEIRYAVKSIKYGKYGPEIVMHDKVQALMAIGKYFKLFTDSIELTGKNGTPLNMITGEMTPQQALEAYQATLKGNVT